MSLPLRSSAPSPVAQALERACARLLSLQAENGHWRAELETNVTMDAEDLMLRQFLGIRGERETRESAAWIRSSGWSLSVR